MLTGLAGCCIGKSAPLAMHYTLGRPQTRHAASVFDPSFIGSAAKEA